MTKEEIASTAIPHLRGQFERAAPILFTGAGFSVGTKNKAGDPLPSNTELKGSLWTLCFPQVPYEPDTSLPDLYDTALRQHPKELTELMLRLLSVDADSVPQWYQTVFSMPWLYSYTLNVDDLAQAVSRKFGLPRPLVPLSATARTAITEEIPPDALAVIHLNGTLRDLPGGVTFSTLQYAERLTSADLWYMRLTANLVSHSLVFIGTRLDEPPLWQHLELRRLRGGRGTRELRPRSYLVTPTLDRARQSLLAEFNVEWLPMNAEQFATEVLAQMKPAATTGLRLISDRKKEITHQEPVLPEVSNLSRNATEKSEFLLGQEPVWADLHTGRAIVRDSDAEIWELIQKSLGSEGVRGTIVLTGTAGSGKSTALMRASLRLTSEGVRVGWLGKENFLSVRDIRAAMRPDEAPSALAIDDADLLGFDLANTVRDICLSTRAPLVMLAIRSSRVDAFISQNRLEGVPLYEIAMPHLTDSDIEALIDVLDRENRLGVLKGKGRHEQIALFRTQAGRQLLVAMIQATSGRRFEEKVTDELIGLEPDARYIYALIAVASNFRFDLSREDILIASGDRTNQALNIVEQLCTRNVVIKKDDADGAIRARHRVIAGIILDELQKTGQLAEVLIGLTQVAAVKVDRSMPRSNRAWRLLRALINHDFLKRTVNVAVARNIYSSVEQLLSWDHHYWLQRGALEVELDDELATAENFLNQARSLRSDDPLVENEWAYFVLKKAILAPGSGSAPGLAREGVAMLEDLIERRGKVDPYPYHVLGSQGLSWSRRGIASREERAAFLRRLEKILKAGCEQHSRSDDLKTLREDVSRELLSLAVH